VTARRYRWVVLGAGTAAQASLSAVLLGIAVLAPALRVRYGLTLGQTGVVLAALNAGMTPTLLAWGLLADRIGERRVLASGLAAAAGALAGAAFAGTFGALVVLIVVAGVCGASVNAASGRAVMQWFPQSERGLALGIRQTAVPLGGTTAAVALPPIVAAAGVRGAFLALAFGCAAGALGGALLLRDPATPAQASLARPLRDPATWWLSWGSSLLLVGQIATMGFTVLFLQSARGWSTSSAAAVLAGAQVLGAGFRIGAGHWSDRLGVRIEPMRRLALGIAVTLLAIALLTRSPAWLLAPALVVAGGFGLSWNGLSFTAAAETAGTAASGAALGLQQTVLGVGGAIVPIGFAALVAASSWRTAFLAAAVFPLAGWAVLGKLR
jgi:MFS family permease